MNRNSLIFKTILVLSAIVLLALTSSLIMSVNSSTKSLKNVIANELMNKSAMTGHQIDNFFDQRIRDVRVLSQADVLESTNKESQIQYFDEILEANPVITNIWVLDEDKQSLTGTDSKYAQVEKLPEQLNNLIEGVFESKQGDVLLTDAIQFEKGMSVFLITPITDDSNIIVISALVVQVSFKPIEEIVSEFNDNVIGDKYVYLLNDDSEVIATDDSLQPILSLFKDINVRDDLLRSTEIDGATGYEIYDDYYGVEVMAGMADMEAHGKNEALDWGIVAVAEISAIGAPAYKLRDNLIWLTIIIAIIIVVIMTFFLRYLLMGLSKITNTMKTISMGNIAQDIDKDLLNQKDEIGILANSFDSMIKKLREIVYSIKESSANVKTGSQQVAVSAQQVAQGSNEQAASVEQISASIEEMVASINQNSDNAQQTEIKAKKAVTGINEGLEAATITLNTMQDIAEKIQVITKIAEKTDLLAINAAVEAARAGETGKGFSVVAGEIRRLAEDSQKSANEIIELTESSVAIAEKSKHVLTEIMPDVEKTSHLVQEIAASSTEQNTNAHQVNKAVQELNSVVLQNSSMSEELSTSSEELASQSNGLQEATNFFVLDKTENKLAQIQEKVMQYVTTAFKDASKVDDFEITVKPTSQPEPETKEAEPEEKPAEKKPNNGIDLGMKDESSDNDFEKY